MTEQQIKLHKELQEAYENLWEAQEANKQLKAERDSLYNVVKELVRAGLNIKHIVENWCDSDSLGPESPEVIFSEGLVYAKSILKNKP